MATFLKNFLSWTGISNSTPTTVNGSRPVIVSGESRSQPEAEDYFTPDEASDDEELQANYRSQAPDPMPSPIFRVNSEQCCPGIKAAKQYCLGAQNQQGQGVQATRPYTPDMQVTRPCTPEVQVPRPYHPSVQAAGPYVSGVEAARPYYPFESVTRQCSPEWQTPDRYCWDAYAPRPNWSDARPIVPTVDRHGPGYSQMPVPKEVPFRSRERVKTPPLQRKEQTPQRYNGKGDLKDFLSHFNAVAKWNGWNDDEKGLQLGISLVEDAREVFASLPASDQDNFEFLCEALTSRFAPEGRESQFVLQLMSRKCGKDEDVSTYGHAMRRLAVKAYPGQPLQERFLVDLYVNGLPEPEIQTYVHLQSPDTLAKAINYAVTFEACSKRSRGRADTHDTGVRRDFHKPKPSHVAPVISSSAEPALDQNAANISKVLQQQGETLRAIADKVGKLESQAGQSRQGNFQRQNRGYKRQQVDLSKVRCFGCFEWGHYASECPQGQLRQGGPNTQSTPYTGQASVQPTGAPNHQTPLN